jgi:hypothetical protein
MKRRDAVKGIILFSLGTGILYSCADKYKAIRTLRLNHFEPLDEELDLLASLSNTIVPLNTIPDLINHTPLPFIFTMLDDVYNSQDRKVFQTGYQQFDAFIQGEMGKKFSYLSEEEQKLVVAQLNDQKEDRNLFNGFFSILKTESINYLKTSEYYNRKINYYEMAPGRFRGDILISDLKNVNEV